MAKFSLAVLLLLIINVDDYFAMGQSTAGDCKNDEQDNQYSDALFAVGNRIQSEVHGLKAQVSRLEDSVESQKLSGSRCPNGFNITANGFPKCYTIYRRKANWNASQQACRRLHRSAHLAVINVAMEQQIVNSIIQNNDCREQFYDASGNKRYTEYYWIGGQLRNESDCSSPFLWKPDNRTSLPISYINWNSGEPNCAEDIEKCMGIRTDGQWNDLPCHWTFCSVCEITV